MPIYLDRDPSSPKDPAGEQWLGGKSAAEFRDTDANCLDIGLINNMPDGALKATERQYIRLLDLVADRVVVRLSLYALPDIPRTDLGRRRISGFYSSIEDLWNRHLDGLIVTGTEPLATNLEDEPCWANMVRVLEWAEHNTCSAVWSCLAAHAAVLHGDGIARRRLSEKRFGVFQCTRVLDHHLLSGIGSRFAMPHSRWNDVSEDELKDCGYYVLARAEGAGVDMFVKQRKSLFVFFQGHPEYEARTLLLEYCRDLRRYLRRESDHYPVLPHAYFDRKAADALTRFSEPAVRERHEELFADFPIALAERNLADPWRLAAARLYGNWLMRLCRLKDQALKKRQKRGESPLEGEFMTRHRAAAAD
jgi:homoserine O-succinyltransferase